VPLVGLVLVAEEHRDPVAVDEDELVRAALAVALQHVDRTVDRDRGGGGGRGEGHGTEGSDAGDGQGGADAARGAEGRVHVVVSP
jgi:hypothetical protein